jgi:carotenoid cleavage dioxygenase-like enzyme
MDDMLKIVGVAKYDLSLELELGTRDLKIGGNIKGLFLHGDGRQGSEPIFVPRTPSKELLEDDGYLICFVYDKKVGCSEMVIIDAKTMASKPVGVVNLPTRVPGGLHSIFLSKVCISPHFAMIGKDTNKSY